MSRRKAIQAAVDRGWVKHDEDESVISGCRESATIAYDLGRIAGLREARLLAIRANGLSMATVDVERIIASISRRLRP